MVSRKKNRSIAKHKRAWQRGIMARTSALYPTVLHEQDNDVVWNEQSNVPSIPKRYCPNDASILIREYDVGKCPQCGFVDM